MRTPVRLAAGVVAALLTAVTAAVMAPTQAAAGSGRCAPGTGVTVVVDYGGLGGGTQVTCDEHGGGDEVAWDRTEHAGFPLSEVASEPGFVCSISGRPDPGRSCQRTPPSHAYWGLFWSNGSSTTWTYSGTGARGLTVPEGASIGWRWQNGGARENPSAAPTVAQPSSTPTPTPSPTPQPDQPSGGGGGNGGDGGSGGGGGGGNGGGANGPPSGPKSPSATTPSDDPSPEGPGAPEPPAPSAEEPDTSAATGAAGDATGTSRGRTPAPARDGQERPQAESPDRSSKATSSDRVVVTASDADLEQAARPGTGDGVLTALATSSIVLLGAAAGAVGWRRRS